MSPEEVAREAIKHAVKELRKRHLLEGGAHGSAFTALSHSLINQNSEWKEKTEKLEEELHYKAQSLLSDQLVVEVAESRLLKASLQEEEVHPPKGVGGSEVALTNPLLSSATDADGNLRLWDIQSGKMLSEVAAHSYAVTSFTVSRNGNMVLTSGRDNLLNLFDVRSLEGCGILRANGHRVASNWSGSCISPEYHFVASGSADGAVYVWSVAKADIVSTLMEHIAPVLSCSWSRFGIPLFSAEKNRILCTWN